MAEHGQGLLAGKRGLVMGVANNRSIAWGIARSARAHGARARLHLSGRRPEEAGRAAGRELGAHVVGHCDVTDAGHHRRGVRRGRPGLPRGHRLRRPLHRLLRQGRADRPLRRDARGQLHQVAPDLLLLVHGGGPARREDDAARRLAADADLLRRREVDAALQRHGRRQGGARSLRALPRGRSRPEEHPRQRDLGRPDQDAGGLGHRRLPLHPEVERVQLAAAPDGDDRARSARRRPISSPTWRAA